VGSEGWQVGHELREDGVIDVGWDESGMRRMRAGLWRVRSGV
jgi:hypothetical protein